MEGDLNPAYISALAALAGALIGGLTSFATSWLTQRAQLRHAHREAESAELKALYTNFIFEAARIFVDALAHNTDEFTDLVRLYAMVGHMRLVSDSSGRGLGQATGSPRSTWRATGPAEAPEIALELALQDASRRP